MSKRLNKSVSYRRKQRIFQEGAAQADEILSEYDEEAIQAALRRAVSLAVVEDERFWRKRDRAAGVQARKKRGYPLPPHEQIQVTNPEEFKRRVCVGMTRNGKYKLVDPKP